MSASVTLREILNQFRKSDLVEIAKIHHLRGWSQYNKAKMIEFLQEKLLDAEVMRQYFMFLSEAELELLDSQENEIWIEPGDDRYDYLIEGAYVGLSCEWSGNLLCVPSDVKTAYDAPFTSQLKKRLSIWEQKAIFRLMMRCCNYKSSL